MAHGDMLAAWMEFVALAPMVGSRWKHVGTSEVYEVTSLSLDEATEKALVTYRRAWEPDGIPWTRTWENFADRFRRL